MLGIGKPATMMDQHDEWLVEEHVGAVERFYRLTGLTVADVSPMAFWRLEARRRWHWLAWLNFACLLLNLVIVLNSFGHFWWLNGLVLPLSAHGWFTAERGVLRMNRQLKRRAAEQLLRDRLAIFD